MAFVISFLQSQDYPRTHSANPTLQKERTFAMGVLQFNKFMDLCELGFIIPNF